MTTLPLPGMKKWAARAEPATSAGPAQLRNVLMFMKLPPDRCRMPETGCGLSAMQPSGSRRNVEA